VILKFFCTFKANEEALSGASKSPKKMELMADVKGAVWKTTKAYEE